MLILSIITLGFLKEIRYQKNPLLLDISFGLYTLGGVLSLFFSYQRINSFPAYFLGILFFSIIITLNSEETKKIFKIMLFSGLFISLYGIYQYLFGFAQTAEYILKTNPYFFTNHLIRNYLLSHRIFALFFSPNMLAGYLIMLIPLGMGYFSEKKKSIFYFFSGIMFFTLLLTQSLGGIISLIISFVFLFLIIRPQIISKRYFLFSLIIILVLIMPIVYLRANRIFNFENPHNSLIQRINFIRLSLKIIKDNLFKGVGMGNFGDTYLRYRKPDDIRTNYAHNLILQIQAELGIFGGLGIILIILLFIRDVFAYRKRKFSFSGFSLLWAGTAFLIHNLIDLSFFIPEVAIFFWIIWAGFKNLSVEKTLP
ncbi:MAG: O-antigen ligase family protein [Candidatus Omnitrophica bacterium]|nr:O-antigen ligase family protein [Candidatus Omnitrophota bacterium]